MILIFDGTSLARYYVISIESSSDLITKFETFWFGEIIPIILFSHMTKNWLNSPVPGLPIFKYSE